MLGLAQTLEEALYKGLIGAGYTLKKHGGVFITVRNSDKGEIADVAKKFYDLGFTLYATKGTAAVLDRAGIPARIVDKIHESDNNTGSPCSKAEKLTTSFLPPQRAESRRATA